MSEPLRGRVRWGRQPQMALGWWACRSGSGLGRNDVKQVEREAEKSAKVEQRNQELAIYLNSFHRFRPPTQTALEC
jgi:hypothetical protein